MAEGIITDKILKDFLEQQEEPFNCEFSFQFALAWYLKEKYTDEIKKVEFESKNAYTDETKEGNRKCRCDLVFTLKDDRKVYIELKYIYHTTLKNKGTSTTSVGARKSFIKDLTRLKEKINDNTNNDERYCIFLTNWDICYKEQPKEKVSATMNIVLQEYNKNYRDKISQKWIYWKESDKPFKCLFLNVKKEKPQKSYDEVMKNLSNDSE